MTLETEQSGIRRGLVASLGQFTRWLVSLSLFVAAVTALVLYLVQTRLDSEIRRHILWRFQSHYVEHQVEIGDVRRIEGRGIELRNVSIAYPGADGKPVPLVIVDELLVRCEATMSELLSGRPRVEQIVLRRPRVRAKRQADGTWELATVFPLPRFSDELPTIVIEDGQFELLDAVGGRGRDKRWLGRHVDLVIRPMERTLSASAEPAQPGLLPADVPANPTAASSWGQAFSSLVSQVVKQVNYQTSIDEGSQANGEPDPVAASPRRSLSNAWPALRLRGQCDGDGVKGLEFDVQFDPSTGNTVVLGKLRELEWKPELSRSLPAEMQSLGAQLQPCLGTVSASFQAQQSARDQPWQWQVDGRFTGRIEDPRLPEPLTQVVAGFQAGPWGLSLSSCEAQAGETQLRVSATMHGWREDRQATVAFRAEQLQLTSRLRGVLPPEMQAVWDRFQPEGMVDVSVVARYEGQRWIPQGTLVSRDVSLAYADFPYRLNSVQGRITLRDNLLECEGLEARAGLCPVSIRGRIAQPGPNYTGWVEVATGSPIMIDPKLIDALPAASRRVVMSMNPQGSATLWARFERLSPQAPLRQRLEIDLIDCSIRYEQFPYRIDKIRGRLVSDYGRWVFQDLEGYNNSAYILCHGGWSRNTMGESELNLHFNAMDVPLEEELQRALAPAVQQQWNQLHPRGTLDQLKVDLRHSSLAGLSVEVTAHKQPSAQNVEGRSISIKPAWFRYQLDNVMGTVRYQNGTLDLQNLRADHGQTRLRVNGTMTTHPSGWKVHLPELHIDRLVADHALTVALPPALEQALTRLKIEGPLSLTGWVELAGTTGLSAPDQATWRLACDLENGRLGQEFPLEHIHGGVTLEGAYNRGHFSSRGYLQVDSLMVKGVQVTQIEGPLSIDSKEMKLGMPAVDVASGSPQPVTGRVFGGTLATNARLQFGETMQFQVDARLVDASLAKISQEATTRRFDISGRALAELYLTGNDRGLYALRGTGRIRLTDADIYELPVMLSLLKLLSIKRPDLTAFTSADMEFQVEQEHLYFQRLNFHGDAISLEGRGEMNLQRAINLTFDTAVGRSDEPSLSVLVRPLLKEAGKRLLVMHVGGTLDEPIVRRQPLPELNQTIQQVFPNAPVAPAPRTTRLRDWLFPR
jgi:hypothetical protein